jgi:hypothetical protein
MAASSKRVETNRENARKSTGPNNPEGKARSSQNARKYENRSNPKTNPTRCPNPWKTKRPPLPARQFHNLQTNPTSAPHQVRARLWPFVGQPILAAGRLSAGLPVSRYLLDSLVQASAPVLSRVAAIAHFRTHFIVPNSHTCVAGWHHRRPRNPWYTFDLTWQSKTHRHNA